MNENEVQHRIRELERKIESLPNGYISAKMINGKEQFYLQWSENGKTKSQYIKKGELDKTKEEVALRKKLREELKQLKKQIPTIQPIADDAYAANVVTGKALIAMAESVSAYEKRDCYEQLRNYLCGGISDSVCLVYGLRRTGKTTMLRQAIGELTEQSGEACVYIKATVNDTMAQMNMDLKKLYANGYRYVFIDEVTLISDFIDSAAIFSDIYAAQGMKIVLSGTDSLGFWFALHQELYDRAVTVHTTFIPFSEHSRLLKTDSLDEYIRYGGTLRAGEKSFSKRLIYSDASFRDDESTRRYIDTAICHNIQNSLASYDGGDHFRHLHELYLANELTGAINRIIEDMNHRFLLSVLTDDFVSHDLGVSARNLRGDRNPDNRTDILDRIDMQRVTERLMDILEIRVREEQSVGITNEHIAEIKEYLKALELISDCPVETTIQGAEPIEHILFTQPGMRYCQAQALVHSLMKDASFSGASEREKKLAADRILEEVRGRMTEEIILLETQKELGDVRKVFKLQFAVGEFDMVVYNPEENTCKIYEIKHSGRAVPEQYRHLTDNEKCRLTEQKFGEIVEKCVIYSGKDFVSDNGIHYMNAAEYLKMLPEQQQEMTQQNGMTFGY